MGVIKIYQGVVILDSGSTVVAVEAVTTIQPWLILLAFMLIIISTFFSASETSLISLSALKVRNMLESGKKSAKTVDKLLKNRERLIGSILIGSNFTAIAFTSILTAIGLQIAGEHNEGLVMILITIISTIIIVVFTDITPKTIASKNPERVACLVARPLSIMLKVLSPISNVITRMIAFALSRFGFSANEDEGTITEGELKTMLEVSFEEGLLAAQESEMIDNVFEFKETTARECMIPRTDIIGIPDDAEHAQVMEIFAAEKYTRLPVYKVDNDHIIGVLNFKDFIFSGCDEDDFEVSQYMREPLYAYESQPTRKLFDTMRRSKINMAVVLDEYGGTAGILTIEDLVEELVGDIFDEHDQIEEEIRCITANLEYVAPGWIKIEDFNETANTKLASEDYETLAGYVLGLFGYIPKQGERVTDTDSGNLTFIVEVMEKNRIEEIRVLFQDDNIGGNHNGSY